MHGWARNHTRKEWNNGYRLEPHQGDLHGGKCTRRIEHMTNGNARPLPRRPSPPPTMSLTGLPLSPTIPPGFWQPNRARHGDTEAKLLNRVAVLDALNLPPRDPRWWNPRREAGWNNDNPLCSNYIPEYGIGEGVGCVGHIEEHVRRPTLSSGRGPHTTDYIQSRSRLGRRTTPLISYNSIGWNRRHYEPIADQARPQSRGAHGWVTQPNTVAGMRATLRSGASTPDTISPSRSQESLIHGLASQQAYSLDHLHPDNGPMQMDAYAQVSPNLHPLPTILPPQPPTILC